MTYSSLPNSGQSLGQTRAAIKNNFDLIKTTLDQNHVDLDLANKGKHYVVQMPVTATIPANPLPPGGLVAGEANLYSKTASAASQVFFSPDASGNEYQLTRSITADFATFGTFTNYPPAVVNQNGGWTFLPGGLLLQYGRMVSTGATTAIVFPVAFTTAVYSLSTVRQQSSSTSYGVGNVTTTGFDFNASSSSAGIAFYWTAIGK